MLGRLVAGVAAPEPEVDASLAAETGTVDLNPYSGIFFSLILNWISTRRVVVYLLLFSMC